VVKTTLAILGATLSFGPAHGAFTLAQAHQTATRYEQHAGLNGQVQSCRRLDDRAVDCYIIADSQTVIGDGAAVYEWQDKITRSGPCSNTGKVVSRRHGVTVQDGGRHYGNCFTGPLVSTRISGSLEQIG
jgi:hypothetical protein